MIRLVFLTFWTSSLHVLASKYIRDASFDGNWRFFRGDDYGLGPISGAPSSSSTTDCLSGFCKPDFDDHSWGAVDLPHDWSNLDLPLRAEDKSTPTLGLRYGPWVFHAGDDSTYSTPALDDSHWQHVKGGEDWRVHSNLTSKNASGWYRQHFSAEDFQVNASAWNPNGLILSLGLISGSDEAYINGVKIGGTGYITKPEAGDYVSIRRYLVPAGLLRAGKGNPNLLAVRVRSLGGTGDVIDGGYPGGFYDNPLFGGDVRSGPFDAGSSPGGRSTGYTVGGIGWYRKHFPTPDASKGQRIFLRFDGVYMNSDVYVNGAHLGTHPYGYTTFEYDITDHLVQTFNQENVVAVKVNNYGKNSRWYSGSGIYRHVWLTVTRDPVYFPLWGVSVQTPNVHLSGPGKATSADISVTAKVKNSGTAPTTGKVIATIVDSSGKMQVSGTAQFSIAAQTEGEQQVKITLSNEMGVGLWSPDSPQLYTANVVIEVSSGASSIKVDEIDQTFGIRTLDFTVDKGFLINGIETKLQGGCVHHDNGPLGSRTIDRAEERRVEILKANGYNAIRTSHNPVSPAFLDACDRLGVMVMDEAFDCWERGKNPDDYHVVFDEWWQRDIQAMVLRDKNHPSIIMWSIGNEIPMRDSEQGFNLSKTLSNYVRSLDKGSGRAVTAATPMVTDKDDGFIQYLDVAGYNYSPNRYESDHDRIPQRIMVGTESFPDQSFRMWDSVWNNSWVLGDFIWTAIDYIGETRIGQESSSGDVDEITNEGPFDWHVSFCGDIDIVGHQKPQSFYRNVLWGVSPLEMLVHRPLAPRHTERLGGWGFPDLTKSWTWPGHEGEPLQVIVYSKSKACSNVTVSLNGKEIGTQPVGMATQITASFSVPYTTGTLRAECSGVASAQHASQSLVTAGKPHSLKLLPDRATVNSDVNDLSYVTVEVLDEAGVLVPDAAVDVEFEVVAGPGSLIAVGTGNPRDISSFQSPKCTSWHGRCVAIVQPVGSAGGRVTLKAAGLGGSWETTLEVVPASKEDVSLFV